MLYGRLTLLIYILITSMTCAWHDVMCMPCCGFALFCFAQVWVFSAERIQAFLMSRGSCGQALYCQTEEANNGVPVYPVWTAGKWPLHPGQAVGHWMLGLQGSSPGVVVREFWLLCKGNLLREIGVRANSEEPWRVRNNHLTSQNWRCRWFETNQQFQSIVPL